MKSSIALAAVAMFALATPAFSQAAGDAGANGDSRSRNRTQYAGKRWNEFACV